MRFDTYPFSPRLIRARWNLGKLASEDVPQLAQDALELGYDGSSTRCLAGLINPIKSEIAPLVNGFFEELGLSENPSEEQAAMILACYIAEAVTAGRVEPYEGARFIWWEIANALDPIPDRLLSFIGEASEYDDCSPYDERGKKVREQIKQQIINDARDLLASASDNS